MCGGAGGCLSPSGATLAKLRLLVGIFGPTPGGGVELLQMGASELELESGWPGRALVLEKPSMVTP